MLIHFLFVVSVQYLCECTAVKRALGAKHPSKHKKKLSVAWLLNCSLVVGVQVAIFFFF